MNLHANQASVCIDVRGSPCGQGYGGGIMRGRTSWWYAAKLNAEQLYVLDYAAHMFVGTHVSYEGGANIQFAAVSPINGLLEVSIDFDGHQGSDC